jgi:hypothetical protein
MVIKITKQRYYQNNHVLSLKNPPPSLLQITGVISPKLLVCPFHTIPTKERIKFTTRFPPITHKFEDDAMRVSVTFTA